MYGWFIAAYLLGLLTGAGLIVAWLSMLTGASDRI